MITLNELQVWAVIGTFAAGLFGMLGFVMTAIQKTITTEIGSLRSELGSEIGSLRSELGSEIGSVRSELGSDVGSLRHEMGVRFDSLSQRIDHLDRDVQFLMKRELEDRS